MAENCDLAFEDWKNGMKYKEIADKYGVSDGTVKSWAARKKWKELKGEGCKQVAPKDEKVAVKNKKVAPKVAKRLQLKEERLHLKKQGAPLGNQNAVGNNGGAPSGNKNNYKHGLYERLDFEFLSAEEQALLRDTDINQIVECKEMIRLCDLQIIKFMRKIHEAENKQGGLAVSGVSKRKEEVKGFQRGEKSDYIANQTVTNTVAVHELVLKYNNEIEKAKKQKIKLLEILLKLAPEQQEEVADDGFLNAMSGNISITWEDDGDGEGNECEDD